MTDAGGTHIVSCSQGLFIIIKKKDLWLKIPLSYTYSTIQSSYCSYYNLNLWINLLYPLLQSPKCCIAMFQQQQTLALHVFSIHSMAGWHEGWSVGCNLHPHTSQHYTLVHQDHWCHLRKTSIVVSSTSWIKNFNLKDDKLPSLMSSWATKTSADEPDTSFFPQCERQARGWRVCVSVVGRGGQGVGLGWGGQ